MKMKDWKTSMIDFRNIYNDLCGQTPGHQKKIDVESCIDVYFGYSREGNLRLSFMSKSPSPHLESTAVLRVVRGEENSGTFWTSFDLLSTDLKDAFICFCANMIQAVLEVKEESVALNMLKRRFLTWKNLFRKEQTKDISKEKIMGAFGELLVLKEIVTPKFGVESAVLAWGGPDLQSKDFTLDNTWYEVKTVGANTDKIRISSLTQLSSNDVGHLVVVSVESASPEYKGESTAIIDLVDYILSKLDSETTEKLFAKKFQSLGVSCSEKWITERFVVKSVKLYKVDEEFPKITEKNIPFPEITDVTYAISLTAINLFIEE